jgi:hypothetical protein
MIASLETVISFIDDAVVETGYRECIEAAHGNTQVVLALELERQGGACPVCGREYRRVDVANHFARFSYYQPACRCFRVCPRCERYMVAERFLEIAHCTGCGFGKRPEVVRDTTRRRRRDGKSAAAGEEVER